MISRTFFVVLFFVATTPVWAQTYSNLDDSILVDQGLPGDTGWGSCANCAGGQGTAMIASSPGQSPSRDGASRDFYISGSPYSDGLWWYKLGPHDSVTHFQFDFWIYFDSASTTAEAFEFDTFQFANGSQYMFGTQCNYYSGKWEVWNASTGDWVQSGIHCAEFKPGHWYHVILAFHRTTNNLYEHYDSVEVREGNSTVTNAKFGLSFPSGTFPPGHENMGVQFQIDVGPTGTPIQEWVDLVKLTTW